MSNDGGWNHQNAEARREKLRQRMAGNPHNIGGRLKGSKNKKPYPITEAVLAKFENHPPPSWKGKKHKPETLEKMSISASAAVKKRIGARSKGRYGMPYKGVYELANPQKYKGNPDNVIYRSLWERAVMVKLDESDDVVEWSSEELRIPYISPLDERTHMYFPDFLIKLTSGKQIIIEVKPSRQTLEPKKKKKMTKGYLTELTEYGRNQAKWEAARAFCAERGWQFMIMTEEHPWLQVFGQPAKYFHGKQTKSKRH